MNLTNNATTSSVVNESRASLIEARDITKTYDTGRIQVQALRGIDLEVTRGDMIAIMGPSGCGKTTLLNCMAGLDAIDSGSIHIGGIEISTMPDNQRARYRAKEMGFVFQFYNLLPVLSAVVNVEMPLLISGVGKREARENATDMLARLGLREWVHHRPAELSGGQRQRVTIARALVNRPSIVWADEPTGDLDSETADDIMALMMELNQTLGQTFVIVTHDPRIGQMTNRIVHMKDGRVERIEAVRAETSRSSFESLRMSPASARAKD
jgi:putative ABC transport system ATP-binding protein